MKLQPKFKKFTKKQLEFFKKEHIKEAKKLHELTLKRVPEAALTIPLEVILESLYMTFGLTDITFHDQDTVAKALKGKVDPVTIKELRKEGYLGIFMGVKINFDAPVRKDIDVTPYSPMK